MGGVGGRGVAVCSCGCKMVAQEEEGFCTGRCCMVVHRPMAGQCHISYYRCSAAAGVWERGV